MRFFIDYKNEELEVEVESNLAEPDVGIFGNGSVAIEILQITNAEGKEVSDNYNSLQIEDIAQEIYDVLGARGDEY